MQVSAAPAAAAAAAPVAQKPVKQPMSTGRRLGTAFAAAAVLFALIALSPAALQVHLTVFALAIVIGIGAPGALSWEVPLNAFVMAMAAALIIHFASGLRGVAVETIVLLGIALVFTFNAALALMQFLASE